MAERRAESSVGARKASELASLWCAFMELAPSPMAAVDGTSHIVRYANDAFCRLVDKPKPALVGKPFRDLLPKKDHCVTLLDRVSRTGKPLTHAQQGHSEPHSVFWSFTMWPVNAGKRASGIVVQVTETAQLHGDTLAMNEALILGSVRQHELTEAADASNADLAASDIAKNQFLAVLSHELRSPLNIILLWSQILKGRGKSDDGSHEGLEIIHRSSKALARLIEDLLDVHRISSGKLRLEREEADLSLIISSAIDSMEPAATEKEIRIERLIDPAPALMSGDPARLQQVIGNVLGNAVKFTPKGGRIRVSLRRAADCAELRVSDSGEGISAASLLHIFERFRQDDPLTSHPRGGLGLGLAIAKQLVDLHGGTIAAASPGKGKGATFTVSLPLLTQKGRTGRRTVSRKASEKESRSLAGVFVLVVDDEHDTRAVVRRVLEDAGAETIAVSSTDEALNAFRQRQPDLILSDIGMPRRDGYELVRSIRSLPQGIGGLVPAIALTAYATSEDRDRALGAGFQTHLAKPVEPATLLAAIAALVSKGPAGSKDRRKDGARGGP